MMKNPDYYRLIERVLNDFKKGMPYSTAIDTIQKLIEVDRDKIRDDLLAIAEKGELEDLRREVDEYFKDAHKE